MNGESCHLSVPSPALAGYLGNAHNRGVVSGACPWCFAKGQKNVLRSYAFNLKESITLCTSPLCLYPLVSGPLDNIRALFSSKDIQGCKRKFHVTLDSEDLDPATKNWKKEDPDIVSDLKCQNVDVSDCRVSAIAVEKELLIIDQKEQQEVEDADKSPEPFHVANGDSESSDDAQIKDPLCNGQVKTWEEPPAFTPVQDLTQMVPTRQHLFWKNKDNLCWLDSLLVALVCSKIFSEASCENECLTNAISCKNFTVKRLCAIYKKTCAYIKAKEQQCEGNIVRVPSDVLCKVEQDLEALLMSAFQFVQPKLLCAMDQKEMPAFALPLLLKSDDWANSLFQHAGQWEFRCTCCGYDYSTRMENTVTTFTRVMADWHPLRAGHRAQCTNCNNKNQKKKLVFQRISSVLALYFVEGLPRRDISKYTFDFQGIQYSIRTIVQYNEQREHFVTWIHESNGLWLEVDDLKYPNCISHKRFTLPASQFHLIFWEADSREESHDVPGPVPDNTPTQRMSRVDDSFQDFPVPDDACIKEALTVNKDSNKATSTWDSSIGSTTLLDTFEGLSHSDVVTLALVEVKENAEENPLPNVQDIETVPAESTPEIVSPTPEIVLPSVVKASESLNSPEVTRYPSALQSSKANASNLSFLFHRHPSHQSTPLRLPLCTVPPKVDLRSNGNEASLTKPAESFGGYRTKDLPNPVLPGGLSKHPFLKLSNAPQKTFSCARDITPVCPVSTLIKSPSQNIPNSSQQKIVLSTEALRLKLMKRLKAKKKKLARLNNLLNEGEGETTPRPDSTNISSPYSVTSSSSVYDSPAFDHFFAELLSPAMSASNQSPDSTGLLETNTNSQSVGTSEISSQNSSLSSKFSVSIQNDPSSTDDSFLDELISGPKEQQSVFENAELNTLDMFF